MASPNAEPALLLKDKAYRDLKALVLADELQPGQVLSERQAALRLGLGLAPVRSAIERLKAEGLLADGPNTGLVVPHLSVAAINDFYETRQVIERHVVQSIAGRIPADRLASLAASLEEQEIAVRERDAAHFQRLDMAFHLQLAECHGNAEMVRILERLRDRMDRFGRHIMGRNPERIAVGTRQHRDIVEALARGDAAAAVDRLDTHIVWGRQMMFARDSIAMQILGDG